MWILAFSCAFVAGVALAATRDAAWLAVLCPSVAFAFLLSTRTRVTVAVLLAGTVAFGFLGAARYDGSLPAQGPSLVSSYNESGVIHLEGTIAEEPEAGGRYTGVLLDDLYLTEDSQVLYGRVRVTTSDPRPLHYGDRVVLHSSLETPQPFDGFDYPRYLALSGVYSTAFAATLEVVPSHDEPSVRARLLTFNSNLGMALASVLPEPESSLAQSFLLGRRGALPDALTDAFARTGTAHLLAISGLHLGILVAALLAVLLAVLGRKHYLYVWFALVALWTYAVFTGLRPPVVRAAIMASTFLLAELAGRQKHAPTALALAAAVMVGIEPQLLWRVSFQLSVLAMAGLVVLFPPLRSLATYLATRIENRTGLRPAAAGIAADVVAATLAATIAVWPVCAGTFGQVSVTGVPVSLLTLPVLPFALASASCAGLVALLSPALAAPFAWLAWMFLSYIKIVVEAFSAVAWATVDMAAGGPWFFASYYALLAAVPLAWQRLQSRRKDEQPRPRRVPAEEQHGGRLRWALPPLMLAATLTWCAVLSSPDGRLHVTFLDVGQGDAILIQSPSGRTVLVDGGPDGQDTCGLIDQHLPFWDRGIDVVVATHPHADHMGGLLTVVDRYRVGLVLQPLPEQTSLISSEWDRRLAERNIDVTKACDGQEIRFNDGIWIEILNPAADPMSNTQDDDDNNGVVVRISYGDISFLLTADIGGEAERRLVLLNGPNLHSTVLKIAHHGSATSSTGRFLAAVQPRMAVVSVGEGNPYGHPDEDVLSRLETLGVPVLATQDSGTIEFVTDGHQIEVSTRTDRRLSS